jgi:hypothetical protein
MSPVPYRALGREDYPVPQFKPKDGMGTHWCGLPSVITEAFFEGGMRCRGRPRAAGQYA